MVWITKRELAYYFILKHVFQNRVFNLGEAFDILILFGTKRTAKKVIRKLTSLGLLEKVGDVSYKVKELEQALFNNLREYLAQRISKRIKVLGFGVNTVMSYGVERLVVQNCDEKLQAIVSMLKDVVSIECIKVM